MEHDGCVGCKYENEPETSERCAGCMQNAIDRYTPATNADRIRSMSDEELARELAYFDGRCGMCSKSGRCDNRCIKHMLDWLRQPTKESANV